MALVVPDVAEIILLQYLLNMVPASNPVLHLYTNNHVPSESTTLGNLTQSTEAGYAPITLPGTSWTTTQSVGVTTGVYSEQTFSYTTGVTVYGYYVTNTSNQLLWVEVFSGGPFGLPTGGGTIVTEPRITLD
jgi:hypothetical protein